MGIIKQKIFADLPFVEGKTYMTKFQTKEMFTVKKVITDKNRKQRVYGIYEKSPHLGECGLDTDRLIADKTFLLEMEVCDGCGRPINQNTIDSISKEASDKLNKL